jgi:iron(III) transport system substrate-binding protein
MSWLTEKYGWGYYESMGKQDLMIVQSALDGPKTIANGERVIAVCASDSILWQRKLEGAPFEIVYPPEGTPPAFSPQGILKQAPHPNAARLFQDYSFSLEGQQLFVNQHGSLSARTDVVYPPGRPGFDKLNIGTVDVRKLMTQRKQIQDKFTDIFGV